MMKFRLSPALKVSFGLMLITISLLALAEHTGLIADSRTNELKSRQSLCQILAVQLSLAVSQRREDSIPAILDDTVTRHSHLQSAGLRLVEGGLIAASEMHQQNWESFGEANSYDVSTSTHVQVPILKGDKRWATVEVVFPPIAHNPFLPVPLTSFMLLVIGMAVLGLMGYWLFLRHALRQLDPSRVVPDEVKSAYNTLAEGVLVLNRYGQIVLANSAFSNKFGVSASALMGKKPSEFPWDRRDDRTGSELPWNESLRTGEPVRNFSLRIRQDAHALRSFIVNAAPVMGRKNEMLGVLVTFDDVTELERTHQIQRETLRELNDTRRELQHRAREFEVLALRDTLTGLQNRRGFMSVFESRFDEAKAGQSDLSCLIIDIDHFKRVNDTYGHGIGDEVIRHVASTLQSEIPEDAVCGRLGGEEFGVLLNGMSINDASAVAEQIRVRVNSMTAVEKHPELVISVSVGAVQYAGNMPDPGDMLNRADVALYHSKESGRNQTTNWVEALGTSLNSQSEESVERRKEGARSSSGTVDEKEIARLRDKIVSLESLVTKMRRRTERSDQIDPDTGLHNRRAFLKRVERWIAEAEHPGQLTSVASIHVETIDRIHEALGDEAADEFVRRLADDLANSVEREVTEDSKGRSSITAMVSRVGTGEFAIGISGVRSTNAMRRRMKGILKRLSQTIVLGEHHFVLTYSIGISICPTDARSADELIRHARAARNDVRRRVGQNSIGISRDNINAHSYRALWIESQLPAALEGNEFTVAYQPKTDLTSGEIVGYEALVRWNHPKLGSISPVEFIPIAERTGFIDTLGQWVLNQACLAVASWREQGYMNLRVAVNLSSSQFRRGKIKDKILQTLRLHNVPPTSLEIEVTESMMLHETPGVIEMMKDLQHAGVRLALDDFGTGYSSLSILKKLPFDSLKIDKSFVGETIPTGEDRVILASIINIAHGLGMSVVAEGVSSNAQLEILEEIGCDEIQGYLVSRAVDLAAVARQLRRADIRRQARPAA